EIQQQLISDVRRAIGPVASFKRAVKVARLPKTRSGKILRKTMRAIANGQQFNVPSTIEDVTVLDELQETMLQAGVAVDGSEPVNQ
ncbi:MAG: propionyl-CoA synthetase, partial [Cyclobacteriaceae bacterium]|nr:propionyl-CoA synthetase [Cyclobacteriaceae bacterium]